MNYNPNLRMPTPEVIQAINTVRQFAYDNNMGDEWSILGIGPVSMRRTAYRIQGPKVVKDRCGTLTAEEAVVCLQHQLAIIADNLDNANETIRVLSATLERLSK